VLGASTDIDGVNPQTIAGGGIVIHAKWRLTKRREGPLMA